MNQVRAVLLILLIQFLPSAILAANGSTPRLNLIMPRGVQRGHEHLLRFSGERLSNSQEIFLYDEGIEVLDIKQVDAANVDVRIRVDAECRLGEHVAQIRTLRGISDFRSFYVGALPDTVEAEPNNSLEQAQHIELNVTANGTITNEDVDIYKVIAEKGQRLSVEIEAMRLGFWFDPFIAVLNERKFEIAVSDDSVLNRQDGLISLIIPEDGDYYIKVREASYGGNENCRYRLHVGEFPRPSIAFPAASPPGKEVEIQLFGDPMGPITQTVAVPNELKELGLRSGLMFNTADGSPPSPVAFSSSELENQFEREPNNNRNKIEDTHTVPNSFNGVISKPGDNDNFKFSASKGEVFDVECFARRIGSGLDPVINIFNSVNKSVAGDDDARRPDCYLRFNVPEDGEYFIRVRDHLSRGQEDFVYRVEVNRVKPKLSILIPRVDRYSQLRQQICVPAGNRFATLVKANRVDFGGELELIADNLPEGITMFSKPMTSNMDLMPVLFEAAADAEPVGALLDVRARLLDPGREISGGFSLAADLSLGQPNNSVYHSCAVDKLACAITQSLPYKIDISQPKVPLVRGGSMNLKIVVTRDEGFDAPLTVQFPFRPPGLGTKPQVEIAKGQSEANYPINANGNAQVGNWPVFAIARANVEGPVWASSQLAELEISEPYVTVEMNRSACEQGDSTSIYCKLNHRKSFEGEAVAEILGVPPNIEIPKLTFTHETEGLTFAVKTNEKSPIGQHKGLFCRVTITENGEQIVSTAARSELQINRPRPAPVAAAEKTTEKAKQEAATTRPKSRLQRLRDAAKKKRGR